MSSRISITRIQEAVHHIDPVFVNSPQFLSEPLSEKLGLPITLKVETENPIRSFKGRGTEWLLANQQDQTPVVCASAGNFGQGMAYSCTKRGVPLTVFASRYANPLKVERMQAFGAQVVLEGDDFDAAKAAARTYAQQSGARFVEDSLDIETVEGAGTIGLELLKLPHELDVLLVALGNGALFTGVAKVFKAFSPRTKVIAVQAAGAPAMLESWQQQTVISYQQVHTIADGIAVRVPVPEVLNDMRELVDDGLLVQEASIRAAMQLLQRQAGLVVEPSGAVGVAALLENPELFRGQSVGTILCGNNMTDEQIRNWL